MFRQAIEVGFHTNKIGLHIWTEAKEVYGWIADQAGMAEVYTECGNIILVF